MSRRLSRKVSSGAGGMCSIQYWRACHVIRKVHGEGRSAVSGKMRISEGLERRRNTRLAKVMDPVDLSSHTRVTPAYPVLDSIAAIRWNGDRHAREDALRVPKHSPLHDDCSSKESKTALTTAERNDSLCRTDRPCSRRWSAQLDQQLLTVRECPCLAQRAYL